MNLRLQAILRKTLDQNIPHHPPYPADPAVYITLALLENPTMDKRYQVFASSTYEDLKEGRASNLKR